MTNLGGHDLEALLEAFHGVQDDRPHCFIAYTIKGYGLPFAGHKDNHAGLMNAEQMATFQRRKASPTGEEWEPFAGLDIARGRAPRASWRDVPFAPAAPSASRAAPRRRCRDARRRPPSASGCRPRRGSAGSSATWPAPTGALAARIVTTSPDVTVSTNLGGWVNRRGVFDRRPRADVFRDEQVALGPELGDVAARASTSSSASPRTTCSCCWRRSASPAPLFGARLLPIGTLYDPFIGRGLDALNYACYQDARFLLVATPSGLTLAPGGRRPPVDRHAADRDRPAGPDLVRARLRRRAGRDRCAGPSSTCRTTSGGSVYLRLSTRPIAQPERAR